MPSLLPRSRLWLVVSAAWLGPAMLAVIGGYGQARLGIGPPTTWRILLWEGGDWLLYGALTPVVFVMARRLPLRTNHLLRRIPLHFLSAVAVSAVWAGLGTVLRRLVVPDSAGWTTAPGFLAWLFITLPFGVAIYFAVLGVEHAAHYFLEARQRETQAARLSAQLAEARLGALRMQLHPHFLLNSLNAILVLVRDGESRLAAGMLERLGEVLHRVLRAPEGHEVALRDEMAFVGRYLAVEEVRFSDRLRVTLDIESGVDQALVPTFVLLPLVENALRHGIARRTAAGRVTISARREGEDLILRVTDDGPGIDPAVPEGVGLSNTRERLRTLYGTGALVTLGPADGGGTVATIRLPFRPGPGTAEGTDE